uniref:Interleukin 17 receptor C n=1 Tax=Latimeria chalumnae TaxID=7897 RepID=H2ZU30_LATCH
QTLSCKMYAHPMPLPPSHKVLALGPVLVPTSMKTNTVLNCSRGSWCHPCIQVRVNMSIWESKSPPRNGGNSKGSRNSFLALEGRILLLFLFFIVLRSRFLEGSVPSLLFVSVSQDTGTVEYNCFKITQLSDSLIKSYTEPRYSDVLDHIHSVPAKTVVRLLCVLSFHSHPFSLHLSTHLSIGMEKTKQHLNVTQEVKVEFADIFPCLCYEAWYTQHEDPIRRRECVVQSTDETFWENLWKRSTLNVTLVGDILLWNFSSPCNITANVTLCLWSGRESRCHDIPHFQQPLRVNTPGEFQGMEPDSSLCVQVMGKPQIFYFLFSESQVQESPCSLKDRQGMMYSVALLLSLPGMKLSCSFSSLFQHDETLFFFFTQVTSENRVIRKCLYKSKCEHLYHCFPVFFPITALQRNFAHLWWSQLFQTRMPTHQLTTLLPPSNLLNQKVLIVYSRDSEPFETLVGTFASLLLDSGLSVTVDLWRRNELSAQGPLLWFHSQRSEILKEGGKIVVLLSEGAAAKSRDWFESGKGSMPQEDPHDSFMASLNCILPDFLQGEAVGRYVVGYFGDLFDQGSIPEMFRGLPAFNFPSQLHKFLAEVAGSCCGKTKRSAFQKNANINIKLQALVKNCQAWERKS